MIKTISSLSSKIEQTESKITPMFDQANRILNATGDIGETIKEEIEMTKPLFNAAAKTGRIAESLADNSEEKLSQHMRFQENFSKQKLDISDWAEWVAQGVLLWKNFKKRG